MQHWSRPCWPPSRWTPTRKWWVLYRVVPHAPKRGAPLLPVLSCFVQVSLYVYMSEFYRSVGWSREGQRVEQEREEIVARDPGAAESSEDEREDSQDVAEEGMTSTGGAGLYLRTRTYTHTHTHPAVL